MKSMMKILARYVASAAGVALILLILNLVVLVLWTVQAKQDYSTKYHISEISDGLTNQNGDYVLSESAQEMMNKRYQWAMLLDDVGEVVWSENLPDDVPSSYTVSEVASFTRWYLNDYPVYVWRCSDGLFVLGSAKGSAWKMGVELPAEVMDNTLTWIPAVLVINGIAAVLLALIFGMRLFRSVKPIAKAIEDMAEKCSVELPPNGLLGDLAAKLNQTSAQLQRQETALQKRDNARTTWIAGVSHDIRTPLSLVMGYASRLEDNPLLPKAEREQAHIIRRQSEKIKTLVSDLNLASKLAYDMQPLRPTSVSPTALVRGVAADFLNSGLDDSYLIDVNIKNDIQRTVITADEELLRRAVSNLIANSIRHNPDGCIVTVSVDKCQFYCEIAISDSGAGFAKEMLVTLNAPGSPVELQNHGLGLTIVQQIARAHGGTVEFNNLLEGGCIAVIRLPFIGPSD